MATPSIDDDLDGPSIDAGLCVEDMASLIFVLLMLKSQDLYGIFDLRFVDVEESRPWRQQEGT